MSKSNNSKKTINIKYAQDSAPLSKIVVTKPEKKSAQPSKVKPKPSK
ncbi:hypothetical protein [Francisella uliginis]|nr:hypothetical protein [Francisella uliginis]